MAKKDNADLSKGKTVEISQISGDSLPRRTLEQAVEIAKVIHQTYAGKSATMEELASTLGIGTKSTNIKYLVWSAQSYGIITKDDENYHLSETGRKIIAPTYSSEDREAKIKSLLTPAILSKFYNDYNGHPLPSEIHLKNILETRFNIPRNRIDEAIKTIIDNAEYASIMEKTSTGENKINLEAEVVKTTIVNKVEEVLETEEKIQEEIETVDWDKIIFYISPIGEDGSEVRKHSDMMLRHLVEPASKSFGLKVIRADKIERSGLITQQILTHLVKCKLCLTDLSFNNPNVFYELGVRHMMKLPTIQLIRKGDKIPFDVSQSRTITIDTSDIYTIMDRFESARRELMEHMKPIIENKDYKPSDDNPISFYLPKLKIVQG